MLRMTRRTPVVVFILIAAAAVAIAQGQPGQGTPGARPGSGREPEFPIPDIREYKPESTLVVPQHPVPKARFPVIDLMPLTLSWALVAENTFAIAAASSPSPPGVEVACAET